MPSSLHNSLRVFLLAGVSLVLCSLTVVLGAIPLHAWRVAYGRSSFFFGSFAVSLGLFSFGSVPLASCFSFLALLVFFFNEFEDRGSSTGLAVFWSVAVSAGLGLSALKFKATSAGLSIQEWLKPQAEAFMNQLKTMNPKLELDFAALYQQAPSGVLIFLGVSLALAIVFENRMRQMLKLPLNIRLNKFLQFRVPDATVWLMLFALLAAFLRVDNEALKVAGGNLLNVLLFVYFVQGMAIVTQFFISHRVAPMWRSILYFLIVLQFFVFVSGLGFMDYWVDFRKKILDNEETKKKIKTKGGIL